MAKGRRSFSLLYRYIAREYLFSFFVSFLFFFFIFFVNQILVLAQEILIKNVSYKTVLRLVIYTIPQFLLYTFPFSSLTGAAMVIGDLSSKNEILAVRFSGIHLRNVFIPVLIVSLFLSAGAISVSNYLVPYTSELYKVEYQKILKDLPTLEIESYNVNRINDIVLSNGLVEDSIINNITIFDTNSGRESNVITSEKGTVNLIDLNNYIYELDLVNPSVITTFASEDEWSVATAEAMQIYLDFSNMIPSVQSLTPSQMSLQELNRLIRSKKADLGKYRRSSDSSVASVFETFPDMLHSLLVSSGGQVSASALYADILDAEDMQKNPSSDFYLQYYRSEKNKKLALSTACTFLVFIAFPISFFKVRYGRLIGFALSVLVSVAYWFSLFYLQLKSINLWLNPVLFMWIPNIFFCSVGLVLLKKLGRT